MAFATAESSTWSTCEGTTEEHLTEGELKKQTEDGEGKWGASPEQAYGQKARRSEELLTWKQTFFSRNGRLFQTKTATWGAGSAKLPKPSALIYATGSN